MISPALQALAAPVDIDAPHLERIPSEDYRWREGQSYRQPVGFSPATSGFQCHRIRFRADRDGFNLLKNLTIRTGSIFCNFRNCHAASQLIFHVLFPSLDRAQSIFRVLFLLLRLAKSAFGVLIK